MHCTSKSWHRARQDALLGRTGYPFTLKFMQAGVPVSPWKAVYPQHWPCSNQESWTQCPENVSQMLPPLLWARFKQFKPKLYRLPLNIPLSSFSVSGHEQTRKEKKKLKVVYWQLLKQPVVPHRPTTAHKYRWLNKATLKQYKLESSFSCCLVFFCLFPRTFITETEKLRTEEMSVK